jgi:hypothetical protein
VSVFDGYLKHAGQYVERLVDGPIGQARRGFGLPQARLCGLSVASGLAALFQFSRDRGDPFLGFGTLRRFRLGVAVDSLDRELVEAKLGELGAEAKPLPPEGRP